MHNADDPSPPEAHEPGGRDEHDERATPAAGLSPDNDEDHHFERPTVVPVPRRRPAGDTTRHW